MIYEGQEVEHVVRWMQWIGADVSPAVTDVKGIQALKWSAGIAHLLAGQSEPAAQTEIQEG